MHTDTPAQTSPSQLLHHWRETKGISVTCLWVAAQIIRSQDSPHWLLFSLSFVCLLTELGSHRSGAWCQHWGLVQSAVGWCDSAAAWPPRTLTTPLAVFSCLHSPERRREWWGLALQGHPGWCRCWWSLWPISVLLRACQTDKTGACQIK